MQTIRLKRMFLRFLLSDDAFHRVTHPDLYDRIYRFWCMECAVPYAICSCITSEHGDEYTPMIILED